MHQRAIGDTTATVIGLGDLCLAVADARGYGATEMSRIVHEALGLGVTLVEASDEEAAERMIGDAVRSLRLRDRVLVATHMSLVAEVAGRPRDVLPERLPPRYVQDRIEASLRATRLDVLPLAFLPLRPSWASSRAWPELAGTCVRLVREGKVLRWGARLDLGDDPEPELEAAAQLRALLPEQFVALSVTFNACDRRALPLLAGPLPVLAREPLAGGALAGTLGPGGKLSPRDDRGALTSDVLERVATGVARLAPLVRDEPAAARSCDAARGALERGKRPPHVEATTVAELALRFAIDRGALPMPRVHRREHIAELIAVASSQPLSTATHAAIERALDQNSGGGTKPRTT